VAIAALHEELRLQPDLRVLLCGFNERMSAIWQHALSA